MRRGALWAAAMLTATVVAGGIALMTVWRNQPIEPALRAPNLTPDEAAVLVKLDERSRLLAETLAADEIVSASFMTGDWRHGGIVADRARALGLEPTKTGDERPVFVQVLGPRTTVLAIAAMREVNRVVLEEDWRALRPVAAPISRPASIPQPGRPYAETGLPVPGETRQQLGGHQLEMIARIGHLIVTVDGRPYTFAETTGGCDAGTCWLSVNGTVEDAGGSSDYWTFKGTAATGWIAGVDETAPPMLHGAPRWMVREAERIARADRDAAAAIAAFDVIGQAQWDPSEPGVVILRYPNGCGCCGGDAGHLAALGDIADVGCVPDLLVVVDVDEARVLAVRPA